MLVWGKDEKKKKKEAKWEGLPTFAQKRKKENSQPADKRPFSSKKKNKNDRKETRKIVGGAQPGRKAGRGLWKIPPENNPVKARPPQKKTRSTINKALLGSLSTRGGGVQ